MFKMFKVPEHYSELRVSQVPTKAAERKRAPVFLEPCCNGMLLLGHAVDKQACDTSLICACHPC